MKHYTIAQRIAASPAVPMSQNKKERISRYNMLPTKDELITFKFDVNPNVMYMYKDRGEDVYDDYCQGIDGESLRMMKNGTYKFKGLTPNMTLFEEVKYVYEKSIIFFAPSWDKLSTKTQEEWVHAVDFIIKNIDNDNLFGLFIKEIENKYPDKIKFNDIRKDDKIEFLFKFNRYKSIIENMLEYKNIKN